MYYLNGRPGGNNSTIYIRNKYNKIGIKYKLEYKITIPLELTITTSG